MTVGGIKDYLKQHWPAIREQLLNGTYEPKPVRRVEIPKPDGGGVRKLGIPSVLDRFIQQAVMQVLQRRWDRTFSDYSYGFRPGRSAQQAVAQAQSYVTDGYGFVVDIDLAKFFDRVNHDRLMARVAARIRDRRLLERALRTTCRVHDDRAARRRGRREEPRDGRREGARRSGGRAPGCPAGGGEAGAGGGVDHRDAGAAVSHGKPRSRRSRRTPAGAHVRQRGDRPRLHDRDQRQPRRQRRHVRAGASAIR